MYVDFPHLVGFGGMPVWWALPILGVAGLLVALTISRLPGTGNHLQVAGYRRSRGRRRVHPRRRADAPRAAGRVLAALATLAMGAVLEPEAPLIALGGRLGLCAVRLSRRARRGRGRRGGVGELRRDQRAEGSPILGAFLLMEAIRLGGPALGLVVLPGLLSAVSEPWSSSGSTP